MSYFSPSLSWEQSSIISQTGWNRCNQRLAAWNGWKLILLYLLLISQAGWNSCKVVLFYSLLISQAG